MDLHSTISKTLSVFHWSHLPHTGLMNHGTQWREQYYISVDAGKHYLTTYRTQILGEFGIAPQDIHRWKLECTLPYPDPCLIAIDLAGNKRYENASYFEV